MKSLDNKSIIKVLQSGDSSLRKETIESLMFNPIDDEILRVLCGMLTDTNKGVRSSVSIALSSNASWGASKYLVSFISSPDIVTRNLAGEILMDIGTGAVDDLINRLPGSDAADEKFIIDLLGQIGDSRADAPIVKVINKSEDENVILACIEALGNLKAIEAAEILIGFYDKTELYRPVIMEALGKIGGETSRNFMIKVFDHSDVLTKYSIIEALENIGDSNSCQFLLSRLSEFDGPLSWSLVKTISNLHEKFASIIEGSEKLKHILLDTIHEADIEFKIAAVKLAMRINGCGMVQPFLEVYGYAAEIDEDIKQNLIAEYTEVLNLMPGVIKNKPNNLRVLLALLSEILDIYTESIKHMVFNMQSRSLSDSLTKLLIHPDEEIRRLSFEILFRFDLETALLFLDEMLDDENFWNRLRLAEILAGINDQRALDALNKLETDENEMVSENAKNLIIQKKQ